MIIVLTGAHGTGKSTLLQEIKKLLDNTITFDSVTRKTTSQEERRVESGVSDETQLRILEGIQKSIVEIEKTEAEHPENLIVMDRGYFDFVAYSRVFCKEGKISKETLNKIESFQSRMERMYSIVFYVPICFDIVDDGIRSLDKDLQTKVDQEIRKQLRKYRGTVVKLGKGNVKSRYEKVVEAIGDFGVVCRDFTPEVQESDRFRYIRGYGFGKEIFGLWNSNKRVGKVFYIYMIYNSVIRFSLLEEGEKVNTIRGLFTEQEFRGKGCAGHLLDAMKRYSEDKLIWVNIGPGAEKLYESKGFTIVGHRKDIPELAVGYYGNFTREEAYKLVGEKVKNNVKEL